jgi:hypothetical protein
MAILNNTENGVLKNGIRPSLGFAHSNPYIGYCIKDKSSSTARVSGSCKSLSCSKGVHRRLWDVRSPSRMLYPLYLSQMVGANK